jgi:aconitate hydratase
MSILHFDRLKCKILKMNPEKQHNKRKSHHKSETHPPTAFTPDEIIHQGQGYFCVNLREACGSKLAELPYVLRLLLENLIRHTQGTEREAAVMAMLDWLHAGSSEAEIPFTPGRVLMHDTTSTPALVDIAAMRDSLAEAGLDPALLNPRVLVDICIDHSLAVEAYGKPDAPQTNMAHEIRRNSERYRFLRWAAGALRGVRIHPPGTGIMHTVNLEQLATVVTEEQQGGHTWLVPDTVIGTDSHTPMVNGIGVLGWGVGGLEAQTVMFGMPTMLRLPDVLGVRLLGQLPPGVLATDLALVVTQRLRREGVSGEFVEFFGPGVANLSAGERAVVANMAPEYGATTGFFPVDVRTLDYLKQTGRSQASVGRTEAYLRHVGLWFDATATPRYTRMLEIDLGAVGIHVAGPTRPQDLLPAGATGAALAATGFSPVGRYVAGGRVMPKHPVAIAAITSCTNTSDPALLVAAGLLARKARAHGLAVPAWVKTSLAPGSPAATHYLRRAGLLEDLEAIGFSVVGYGCTTCIGNPGPLPLAIVEAQGKGAAKAVAILSGNRNFPGRVHPDLELGFIMSPPLVIAFALAGDASADIASAPLGKAADGAQVFLRDLWPSHEEVAAHVACAVRPGDFADAFSVAAQNESWHALEMPTTSRFPWSSRSTILRRPPFAAAGTDGQAGTQLGHYTAYPLLVLGDDVTTDHISPASAIPQHSEVADFLVSQGDNRHDLNVFASRRGNWQVMLRAAFHNKMLVNLLSPGAPVAHTLHVPSGEVMPLWQAARRYRGAGESLVLVAGERFGTGSSRDWAAKGQRLLGIRAVLAASFERIHRSNLIGMGILPLQWAAGAALTVTAGDRIEVQATSEAVVPRGEVAVVLHRTDGSQQKAVARAAVETQLEVMLLREGGVIPTILRQTMARHAGGADATVIAA